MIKKFLKKTFNIRDGEITISFLMQLYVFLIITILLIFKPTVNALFLKGLGADNLAFAYLLIAGIAVVTSYFYNKAVRFYSLKRIIIFSLSFFAIAFIVLSVLYKL